MLCHDGNHGPSVENKDSIYAGLFTTLFVNIDSTENKIGLLVIKTEC